MAYWWRFFFGCMNYDHLLPEPSRQERVPHKEGQEIWAGCQEEEDGH